MISGYNLASRDIGGYSDPYLKLSIGNKHFDFETIFPGCPLL
jgi:Ca2+-dependent lipid-binding protein